MCKNGRRPKDGPSVAWLACILYGYIHGYRASNGWSVGGMAVEKPENGTFYVSAGAASFKVTVEQVR